MDDAGFDPAWLNDAEARMPLAVEFTLASLVVVASQIGAEPVQALTVEFAHAAPAEFEPFRQVFAVVPRFEAPVSCLVLAREVLDRPVPAANPGLSRIVTAHAEQLLAASAAARETVAAQVSRQLARHDARGSAAWTSPRCRGTVACCGYVLHWPARCAMKASRRGTTCSGISRCG